MSHGGKKPDKDKRERERAQRKKMPINCRIKVIQTIGQRKALCK